jgi:hypothetical protein
MKPAILILVFALSLTLTACAGASPSPAAQPSATPAPTPMTGISAMEIVSAFMAAGIPAAKPIAYTPYNDPDKLLGQPNQYVQKVNWDDSLVNVGSDPYDDATIEVFANPEDARARLDRWVSGTKDHPGLQTYNTLSGIYLMRLSSDFTPDQAKEYETVFLDVTR